MLKVGDLVRISMEVAKKYYDTKIVYIIPAGVVPSYNDLVEYFQINVLHKDYRKLSTHPAKVNRYVVRNQEGGYLVFPEIALGKYVFTVSVVPESGLYFMMKKAEEQRKIVDVPLQPLPNKPSPRHIRMEEDSKERNKKKRAERVISLAEMLLGIVEEEEEVETLENMSDTKLIEKVRESISGYNPALNELVVRFKRYKKEACDASWIGKEDMGR